MVESFEQKLERRDKAILKMIDDIFFTELASEVASQQKTRKEVAIPFRETFPDPDYKKFKIIKSPRGYGVG